MLKKSTDCIMNKVYEYRVLKKMSQSELADVVGVSKQTIFVMEKNNYIPSLLLAYRIANFFEVSIDGIFTYTKGGNKDV
ncbi:helix-turn-helix transcriptional regulator [Paenibacillus paeoniae]